MNFKNSNLKKLFIAVISIAVLFLSTSCGKIWDPADARKVSPNSKVAAIRNTSTSGDLFVTEMSS